MELRVLSSPDQIRVGDLLVDSSWPASASHGWGVYRIDHHIDQGWTELDSVASAEVGVEDTVKRLCTSYLDPDAIIGAAVLLAERDRWDPWRVRAHRLFRVFYSAAFWADHNTACGWLSAEENDRGSQLEAWLRCAYGEALAVEDRADQDRRAAERRNTVFAQFVRLMTESWRERCLPEECTRFDHISHLRTLEEFYEGRVRQDLCTASVGVVDATSPSRKGGPRAYLGLFEQPVVLRCIRGADGSQMMLGVNPSLPGWQRLNLRLLETSLRKTLPNWNPVGRRGVIGNHTTLELEDVMGILGKIETDQLRDDNPQWSVLP